MVFCRSEGYAPCTLFAELMGLSAVLRRQFLRRQLVRRSCADSPSQVRYWRESVTLAHPVVLEVTSSNGSLKETVQKGQQLTWRRYDRWRYWGQRR